MAKVVKTKNFDSEIKDGVVIVDFFATWCGPCKMLGPVFEELGEEMEGKVKFLKLDVDESPEIAQRYQVSSVPNMLIFKDGEKVDSILGFSPKERIKSSVESHL